ncbi:hypothetical protein QBC40DRAFT_307639 [Triangularia verruculosa]|uniref:Uncharacterized protein n=1 Tax=Triangularia verruculosa TaxID=2587418 RepID=A0AAN7ASA4_9PEZI|nr:hypothetical protein QBC40DRAFT_307639 [Triangularia verruculosa]
MKFNLATPAWALSLMAAISHASPVSQLSPRSDTRDLVHSRNWAGLAINTTTDSPISTLTGVFQLPKYIPNQQANYTNISFALHLGTNGGCGSSAALGIDMAILGRDKATFAAWSHSSLDDGNEIAEVHWLDEKRGRRYDIQGGDEITLTIKTIDHRNLWLQWHNSRTNEFEQLKLWGYNADLCLKYAAWVTEQRKQFTDGLSDTAFWSTPDFGRVVLKGMQWATEDFNVWNTGENKGPAKEVWHVIGFKNDQMDITDTRCSPVVKGDNVNDQGMECLKVGPQEIP